MSSQSRSSAILHTYI
nr:unnamed protein product [Callosobruchus analis]